MVTSATKFYKAKLTAYNRLRQKVINHMLNGGKLTRNEYIKYNQLQSYLKSNPQIFKQKKKRRR